MYVKGLLCVVYEEPVIFVQRSTYMQRNRGGGGGGGGGEGGTERGHKPTCMHSAIVPVL